MAKLILDENGLANEAGTLNVYNYDAKSGELISITEEYLPQGVGLPANATTAALPNLTAGSVAVFRNRGWQKIADHRGEIVYATADGAAREVVELGDYPANTTLLKPATVFDKWNGSKWITDEAQQQAAAVRKAAAEKTARISAANTRTQAWQTQLLLGIITDADKATLTAWMKYIQAVQATDLTSAPAINWPEKPE